MVHHLTRTDILILLLLLSLFSVSFGIEQAKGALTLLKTFIEQSSKCRRESVLHP